jgi:hypothetical protein
MPKAEEMFGDLPAADLAKRHEQYLETLAKSDGRMVGRDEWLANQPHLTGQRFDVSAQQLPARTPFDMIQKTLESPDLVKSMSAEALASLTEALDAQKAQIPDLVKDITTSSPVATGIVAYDLEPGAKMLTPKPTPLRNRVPRGQGNGLAHEYFRITGITGSGTGGVGVFRPGIGDTSQANFAASGSTNNLFYNRGAKISYAGDKTIIPYIQFSASDEVNWSAQYAGRSQLDVRALSRNALIWASMLLEERVMLYGRGTRTGFAGVLTAPTGVACTARAAVASETGLTGVTTTVWVRVVAELGDWGVSQASAIASVAAANGQVVDVTYTLPAGATGAKVFVATGAGDPGDASKFLYTFTGGDVSSAGVGAFMQNGRSGYNKITLQGAIPVAGSAVTAYPNSVPGGAAINLTAADGGSAYVNEYDGVWTYCSGASAGYTKALNGQFSTTNPGVEYQTAFSALYDAVKADPDRILMNGNDRRQLSDTIKGSANSNYGIRLMRDDISGVTLGSVATAILNETTGGGEVQLEVHPWLPQGNSPIISDNLPIPDSQVDSVFRVVNVQDLMGIDWPVNQFTFDASSYWFGTMVCYAPAWLGSLSGIRRA